METTKYLILGAGPSGLVFANRLLDKGEDAFLVLDKEAKAGGLCRSEYYEGQPVDIGGGHFLDTRSRKVLDYVFRFMPEDEWNFFERDSQILFNGNLMGSPFEAHIWQLPIRQQVEYIKSIAVAGCNIGTPKPEAFVDWITWKLGNRIAEDYMLPYNRKMFSENLNSLGTYWLEKLPDVSFEETLMSCLEHKFYGRHPGHSTFYYPKTGGFGEVFIKMQKRLGDHFRKETVVDSIDLNTRTVNEYYHFEKLIVCMPWTEFRIIDGAPDRILDDISQLKSNTVQIDYYMRDFLPKTRAQWIYCPDPELGYHRILLVSNFALGSIGYWTETNGERTALNAEKGNFHHLNQYAYPLNTRNKPQIIERILSWAQLQNIYGLGRWGEWQHFNSDVCMERAMNLADQLCNKESS